MAFLVVVQDCPTDLSDRRTHQIHWGCHPPNETQRHMYSIMRTFLCTHRVPLSACRTCADVGFALLYYPAKSACGPGAAAALFGRPNYKVRVRPHRRARRYRAVYIILHRSLRANKLMLSVWRLCDAMATVRSQATGPGQRLCVLGLY